MNRWERVLPTNALQPAGSRAEMFAPQVAIPDCGPKAAGYGYGFVIVDRLRTADQLA